MKVTFYATYLRGMKMNEIAKLLRQAYSLLVESENETDPDALGLIIEEAQGFCCGSPGLGG